MTSRPRVFFFGMHKILVKTELPRLRALGFEVYCPPYRERFIEHQSATEGWDTHQPSTLPPEVFEKLSRTSFFYRDIPADIADLLNRFFDAVVVTSDPGWLVDMLRVFHGKVIFRAYGQVVNLSDYLQAQDAVRNIVERDDFWFVPHAAEAVLPEHAWLKERMEVVPYVPADASFSIRDLWRVEDAHEPEIMVACPNLVNPFYAAHYRLLKRFFDDPRYRYYGVQMRRVDDPQVVGTLPEADYFARFLRAAGFLDAHRLPTVCFLPPIEMTIAGGPVICLEGSLLSRQLPPGAPGVARDEVEAREKCERLLAGDARFITDVIASQERVRARFMPETVWPIFDASFSRLLAPSTHNRGRRLCRARGRALDGETVTLFAHDVGLPVRFVDGVYACDDPAFHALRSALVAVLRRTRASVVVTCRSEDLPLFLGWFTEADKRLSFVCVDRDPPRRPRRVPRPRSRPARFFHDVRLRLDRVLSPARRVIGAAADVVPLGAVATFLVEDGAVCARVRGHTVRLPAPDAADFDDAVVDAVAGRTR